MDYGVGNCINRYGVFCLYTETALHVFLFWLHYKNLSKTLLSELKLVDEKIFRYFCIQALEHASYLLQKGILTDVK